MTRTEFEQIMEENGITFSLMYGNKCAGYVEFTYYISIDSFDSSIFKDFEYETNYIDADTYEFIIKIYN